MKNPLQGGVVPTCPLMLCTLGDAGLAGWLSMVFPAVHWLDLHLRLACLASWDQLHRDGRFGICRHFHFESHECGARVWGIITVWRIRGPSAHLHFAGCVHLQQHGLSVFCQYRPIRSGDLHIRRGEHGPSDGRLPVECLHLVAYHHKPLVDEGDAAYRLCHLPVVDL